MENTVLGNALEGVPEESSEEGEKPNDSKIESADNLDGLYRDSRCSFGKKLLFVFLYISRIYMQPNNPLVVGLIAQSDWKALINPTEVDTIEIEVV